MSTYSLKEIQLKFGVPQHVLIHLCEKGVIEPEIADPQGRGKVREFSEKNIFEFAVALELRKYQIPLSIIRALITLLSSFEKHAQKAQSKFKLPSSITGSSPELLLHIYEGETVIIGSGKGVITSFDLERVMEGKAERFSALKGISLPENFQSRLTINLSTIAENLSRKKNKLT